jgi:hypothetical protein
MCAAFENSFDGLKTRFSTIIEVIFFGGKFLSINSDELCRSLPEAIPQRQRRTQ